MGSPLDQPDLAVAEPRGAERDQPPLRRAKRSERQEALERVETLLESVRGLGEARPSGCGSEAARWTRTSRHPS